MGIVVDNVLRRWSQENLRRLALVAQAHGRTIEGELRAISALGEFVEEYRRRFGGPPSEALLAAWSAEHSRIVDPAALRELRDVVAVD